MELNAADFQFLRPLWLWALCLLPAIWWWQHRQRGELTVWQRSVDAHLLPHLLQASTDSGRSGVTVWSLVVAALAIVTLAGPSWRELPAPLWQQEAPLVIALDLSSAMRATDLPPSRLIQARAKLSQLLDQRKAGQVGLLVYAGDAFTVAPITRDARTVKSLLDSLGPGLMPVDGQRADRAISRSLKLLRDSGASAGEILLVSDHADGAAQAAAARARAAGFDVSALGVGTLAGAPMTGAQGFITGADGQPQLARLDPQSLQLLARSGGGRYATLVSDDADLQTLGVLDPVGHAAGAQSGPAAANGPGQGEALSRSDDGYWLLLALLPLALLGFRRGWLALVPLLLCLALVAPPTPALADAPDVVEKASGAVEKTTDSASSMWDALWSRSDQRASAALKAGNAAQARALAQDPALQGAAAYRSDDFKAAAQSWAGVDAADAHYNRGNALAKSGDLKGALKAYDDALARDPAMQDAIANRKAVEDFLKQQQQQKQQDQSKDDQSRDEQSKDQQSKDEQSKDQQSKDEQSKDEQSKDEQSKDEQSKDEQSKDEQSKDQQSKDEQSKDDQSKDDQSKDDQSKDDQSKDEQSKDEQSKDEQSKDQQSKDEQSKDQQSKDEQSKEDASKAQQPTAEQEEQQRQAEEAAKREMQQALDAAEEPAPEQEPSKVLTPEERAEAEQEQAMQQWLRRVPDDPGGLLRRKFELEYRRRLAEGEDQ
jgi:Ca-activated chloride channel homolog